MKNCENQPTKCFQIFCATIIGLAFMLTTIFMHLDRKITGIYNVVIKIFERLTGDIADGKDSWIYKEYNKTSDI